MSAVHSRAQFVSLEASFVGNNCSRTLRGRLWDWQNPKAKQVYSLQSSSPSHKPYPSDTWRCCLYWPYAKGERRGGEKEPNRWKMEKQRKVLCAFCWTEVLPHLLVDVRKESTFSESQTHSSSVKTAPEYLMPSPKGHLSVNVFSSSLLCFVINVTWQKCQPTNNKIVRFIHTREINSNHVF